MRLVYHLEGWTAPTAAKIETAASKLEDVQEAIVDFHPCIFLEVGQG